MWLQDFFVLLKYDPHKVFDFGCACSKGARITCNDSEVSGFDSHRIHHPTLATQFANLLKTFRQTFEGCGKPLAVVLRETFEIFNQFREGFGKWKIGEW